MIIDNNKSLLRKKNKEVIVDKEIKEIKTDPVTTVDELLQKQVCQRFHNERVYLAMAIWCDIEGYTETAKFLSKQAIEERSHGVKFINYMLKQDIKVSSPQAQEITENFENLEILLNKILNQEVETTDILKKLHTEALKTSDVALLITEKYLKVQVEKKQLFLSVLNLFKLCEGSKIDFETNISKLMYDKMFKIGNL